ncbi:hypothetical protein ACLMAJ_16480 [Nocardia sp. KC 131]|uniref:linalool dehydratase/isomerase domain-containing protein n=1 Tax=Nocardia arseniciresistens TaxID=3392119 RepID=UPI00398F5BF1
MDPLRLRGPSTARWLRRTQLVVAVVWAAAVFGPALLGLSGAWRAFGAGLVVPGAGLLYAIPALHHSFSTPFVLAHAAVILLEAAGALWTLRRHPFVASTAAVSIVALVAAAVVSAPVVVVVVGHVAAFLGVLVAALWAFMFRSIARSDYVTLPAIVLVSAAAAAGLVSAHADMPGPMSLVPLGSLVAVVSISVVVLVRERLRHRSAQRVGAERARYLADQRTAQPPRARDRHHSGTPEVTEASPQQLALLRYLLSVAMQSPDDWAGFDQEGPGPLQQYRYQLNALGWALAVYGYSHTPALLGPLHRAQLDLIARAQDKAAWGYWNQQNLLGNWDFRQRRVDPVDVPQNIMFTGYLNLQLGMFRQATGDARFAEPGSLRFHWSPGRQFDYRHDTINDIVIRNFDSDFVLWPCEPLPVGRARTHGLVFPYCNAVSAAGVAVSDAVNGTSSATPIVDRFQAGLAAEFTAADGDIVTFIASGLGLTARAFRGPATTAGIAAFVAPLLPDLAWRAWEVLRHEWLDTGQFHRTGSGGAESPVAEDWGSRAKSNAESLAAAMLLAQECGESEWHQRLWREAVEQLCFTEDERQSGVSRFESASVHANGMLGFGALGRPYVLADMMSRPRPEAWNNGPRIVDVPHPEVIVAKAVSDGHGLEAVFYPGKEPGRFTVLLDQLLPRRDYLILGAVIPVASADEHGRMSVTIDLPGRSTFQLRPI